MKSFHQYVTFIKCKNMLIKTLEHSVFTFAESVDVIIYVQFKCPVYFIHDTQTTYNIIAIVRL